MYDHADPNNLFLATIDNEKFEKMANKQNLVIEQFSLMSGHLQELLNLCQMKQTNENDQKFICTLKTATKSSRHITEAIQGVKMEIF